LAWLAAIALGAFILAIVATWTGSLSEATGGPLIFGALGALAISILAYCTAFAASNIVTAQLLEASFNGVQIPREALPERIRIWRPGWRGLGLLPGFAQSREDLLEALPGERRYQAARYRYFGYSLAAMVAVACAFGLEYVGHLLSETLAYVGLTCGAVVAASFVGLTLFSIVQSCFGAARLNPLIDALSGNERRRGVTAQFTGPAVEVKTRR